MKLQENSASGRAGRDRMVKFYIYIRKINKKQSGKLLQNALNQSLQILHPL